MIRTTCLDLATMGGQGRGWPSFRGSAQLSDKEKRLSDALRRNLQRRKQQDRARKAAPPKTGPKPEPPDRPEKGDPAQEGDA